MPISWPAVDDHLRLLGERLDRVAGDEPGRLEPVLVEQLEQARGSRPRRRRDRVRCRPASPRRRRSRASRRRRRRRRRCSRRSPSPFLLLRRMPTTVGWYNATTCALSAACSSNEHWAEQDGGRRGAGVSSAAREPGPRSLRAAARRLGRTRLRAPRPQGAVGRRRRPRRVCGWRRSASPGVPSTRSTPISSTLLAADGKLPVALVTGFLGSGKTTLIARLLGHPEMGETAVIVNEIGEVGIDHHLLRRVDERTVLLESGCVCCTLRGDLADELRDLLGRRDARRDPPVPARRRRDDRTRRSGADRLHARLRAGRQAPLRAASAWSRPSTRSTGLRGQESVKQALPPTRS